MYIQEIHMGNVTAALTSAGSNTLTIGFEVAVIAIVACVIMAFFAMRIYKLLMSLFAGAGLGFIAYSMLLPGAMLAKLVPNLAGETPALIAGIAAAALGFSVGIIMPKFVIFLGGVGIGIVATNFFAPIIIQGLQLDPTVMLIAGIVVGVVVGVLLSLVFKPIYILLTSFGCSAGAGVLVTSLIAPGSGVIIGAIVGACIGIFPAIYQFRWSAYRF